MILFSWAPIILVWSIYIARNWIKYYHTSRPFYAKIKVTRSFIFQVLYGVLHDPLLFILYTIPFSTLGSNSPVDRLNADDTQFASLFLLLNSCQLFILLKIILPKFHLGYLQIFSCLIYQIWFLVFKSSDKQLSKIWQPFSIVQPDVSLYPVSSARNLGFHCDSILFLSEDISFIIKSYLLNVWDFRRIRPFLSQINACNIATL